MRVHPERLGDDPGSDPVIRELSTVYRGRGLRRSVLGPAVGPGLRELLDIPPEMDEANLRVRVADALILAARALDPDLRVAVLHALSVSSAHLLLQDRLRAAGRELDRDARTVRRRLDAANVVLVRHLRRNRERSLSHPQAPAGWAVLSMSSVLDLRRATPRFTATKTVVATQRLSAVTESFSMPPGQGWSPSDEDVVDVAVTSGGRLEGLTRVAPRVWRYHVAIEPALAGGQEHTYTVEVTMPSADHFAPYNAVAPLRPCNQFDCTVIFDPDRLPVAVQYVEALPPPVLLGPMEDSQLLATSPVVSASFSALVPGLVYGLRWRF